MGYRLHVARVYNVEYALGDAFNYKSEEFHNLLSALKVEYTGDEYDSDFEVQKDEWQKAIRFHVQGFQHTGMVHIVLKNEGEDLFEIELVSDEGVTIESHKSIFLDNLISTIAGAVEKVEDYEKRVAEEYPLITNPDNLEKAPPLEIIIL